MSLYRFMGNIIGVHSWNWETFILYRTDAQIRIRKFPNTIGISADVLRDLIKKGCQRIIVKINHRKKYMTDPATWLEKGIMAKLTPDQDLHSFLDLSLFKKLGSDVFSSKAEKPAEDSLLTNYMGRVKKCQ